MKNERGEIITSRKGIANVFGEFHKKIYDDNEQDEYGNESSTDVHSNDTDEMTRIPGKSPDSNGIRAEDTKHATMRQKEW